MNPVESPKSNPSCVVHQLVFLFVGWACFLFYPLWYLPSLSDIARFMVCVFLLVGWIVLGGVFRFLIRINLSWGSPPVEPSICESRGYWFILFGGVALAHLPFLPWPILTGLDTIDHAVVPAVIAHKVVQGISLRVGFSIQPLLILVSIATIAFFLCSSKFREWWREKVHSIAHFVDRHSVGSLFMGGGIVLLYAVLFLQLKPLDAIGDLNAVFRYPPLSKFFSIPLYAAFGLQEWTGRVLQIAFTFGGAVYLYRLTRLFGGRIAAQTSALLFVLLPPIFHYGNTTMIEGGTLFFIIAAFYYWIRFVEYKDQAGLILGTIYATLACLYKHPAVSLIPAFAFMVAYDFLFPQGKRVYRYLLLSILSCAIPAIVIIVYMKLSSFNTDVPSSLQIPSLRYLWGNLQAMPQGITLPLSLLFLAGLVALPFLRSWRVFWIFLGWVGAHYLLTCMSAAAMNVRQALPYYIGLIVPASILVEWLIGDRRWMKWGALYGVLPVFLFWTCLFMDRRQDYKNVGRAMGDRSYINFSNWRTMYLPYPQTIQFLKQCTQPNDVIYAPMINEPVYFYVEKYGLTDRVYRRELWAGSGQQDLESLLAYCQKIHARWLVVVRGRWLYDSYADLAWIEQLFTDPPEHCQLVQVIGYGEEQIGIWELERENGN